MKKRDQKRIILSDSERQLAFRTLEDIRAHRHNSPRKNRNTDV